MNQIFSIKSAAMLCFAVAAMTFSASHVDAQSCGGRGVGFNSGFGGSGISIGYSSGYRGGSFGGYGGYGGFAPSRSFGPSYGGYGYGRGISVNAYRPVTRGGYYGGGSYGRSYGGGYGRSYGHRRY